MTKILSGEIAYKKIKRIFKIFFGIIILIGIIFLTVALILVVLSDLPTDVKIALIFTLLLSSFFIYCLPIILSIYLVIIPFYNYLIKGVKLEVTNLGIDIGQKYAGPFDTSFNKNIYYYPIKENSLFLSWKILKKIQFQKRKDAPKIKKIHTFFLPLSLLTGSLPSMLMLSGFKSSLSECGYIFFETRDNQKYIIDGNIQAWEALNEDLAKINKLNLV